MTNGAAGGGESRVPVALVVPIYNEAGSIQGLAKRVARTLEALPEGSEALLVDDGSTDGSGDLLLAEIEGMDHVQLLRHGRNRGYGAALKTGVRAAEAPLIAITDADGTYPWRAIPKLANMMDGEASMVVGARRIADQPFFRRPAKVFLNRFASWLAGAEVQDINSGLRVFRREDALRLEKLLPDAFSYTSTITMALFGEGRSVAYAPIRYATRVGSSKIRPVRDLSNFILLIARMSLMFNPLKVFGAASAGMLLAGGALLLARVLSPESFGLATTIVLLVGGVQMFAIGLIADLINRRLG